MNKQLLQQVAVSLHKQAQSSMDNFANAITVVYAEELKEIMDDYFRMQDALIDVRLYAEPNFVTGEVAYYLTDVETL